jgi:hypothetical protein
MAESKALPPLVTTVNGVPVVGVPIQDLIETDLEQALPLELWDLFAEETDRTWQPRRD